MKSVGLSISRFLVGTLFIFSGLIKLNDPQGTAIKLHEYFEVFSEDIATFFMVFTAFALPLSVFLSGLEVILGVAVLINYKMKWTTWFLVVLIIFFTFLTFYSAAFNKVTDCGCFGDAIKLTPWQSFMKDLILVVLIAPLFYFRKELKSMFTYKVGHGLISLVTILSFFVAKYAIDHLPFLDFRAYAIGQSIPANLIPAEAPVYGPQVYTYMEKATEKLDTSGTYQSRWNDTTLYKYVSWEKPVLNPDASTPRISGDFTFENEEGEDQRELLFSGKKLLLTSHDWDECNKGALKQFVGTMNNLQAKGITVWINSNQVDKMREFCKANNINAEVFSNDATILKTMVRSNPGALYLEDGVVTGKWHYNDFDDIEQEVFH